MSDRTERDSLGEVTIPAGALYGPQTQRAIENFQFSGRPMAPAFIAHLAIIKAAAAVANNRLALLDSAVAERIVTAALAIARGEHLDAFPVDVFQTGSGTSTNMNMNEVLGHLAGGLHPNDVVNLHQSSNDVVPTCIQVSSVVQIESRLRPAIRQLKDAIAHKRTKDGDVVKTGRTHLMDAMPITLDQEFSAWEYQLKECDDRLSDLLPRLRALPLGGTAVGTGVNCPPEFAALAIAEISRLTDCQFSIAENRFSRIASQDVAVECSAALKALAVTLMKISNDLRWMSSGPLAGLAELELKALQPGSSIMPGKVNPVLPEAVAMIAAEIMGNDVTVSIAAQSGNFQLNVMLPLLADKLLSGIALASGACLAIGRTITDCTVNRESINNSLHRNPILVTALNNLIGYDKAAVIAKRAYKEQRPIIDVALEETALDRNELERLLDPVRLTSSEDTK